MFKNILIYSVIGIYSATSAFAQIDVDPPKEEAKGNTVFGEIIDNRTSGFNLFRVFVPLLGLNGSSTNSSLYTLDGGFFYDANRFNLEAEYSYKVLDKMFPTSNRDYEYNQGDIVFGKYNPTHANHLRVNSTYYFGVKSVEKKYNFMLKEHRVILYQTNVDGLKTTRTGVRLGVEKGVTFVSLNGATLIGKNLSDPNNTIQEFNYDDMSTMMEYTNLNIGITIANTHNMRMDFEGYQKASDSYMTFWNFDLLISVKNKLDDVYGTIPGSFNGMNGNNSINANEFTIDELTEKMPLGFKISYRNVPMLGIISYSFEAGIAPGVKSKLNLFGGMKVQFSLGNRVLEKFEEKDL
jgi:hypothetical protein